MFLDIFFFKPNQNSLKEHTWFLAATPIVLFFDPNDMTDLKKIQTKMFIKKKNYVTDKMKVLDEDLMADTITRNYTLTLKILLVFKGY
jgi:hypothetical protein